MSYDHIFGELEPQDDVAFDFLDRYRSKDGPESDHDGVPAGEREAYHDVDGEDPEHDLEGGDNPQPEHEGSAGSAEHGGGSGGGAASPDGVMVGSGGDRTVTPQAEALVDAEHRSVPEHEAVPNPLDIDEGARASGALAKTDHQDAVQAAATGTRGGDGGGGPAGGDGVPVGLLAKTGFALRDVPEPPVIKRLPSTMVDELRTELEVAARRHPSVSEDQATAFAGGLSQAALVTAFVIAHLDLSLAADESTMCAVALFRGRNPLLGSVVDRLGELERVERETVGTLLRVREDMKRLDERTEVIERGVAYKIADDAENLRRGRNPSIDDVEFNHPSAVRMRDLARDETEKQRRLDAQRDGRPWR